MRMQLLGIGVALMLCGVVVGVPATQPTSKPACTEPSLESLKKEVAILKAQNASLREELAREKIAHLTTQAMYRLGERNRASAKSEINRTTDLYLDAAKKLKTAIDKYNTDFSPHEIAMPNLPT